MPIGAIVAGGGAVRFGGTPKGLQRVGGVRIIDRIAAALRATTSELIVVSNAADAEQWIPGTRVCQDIRPERGSLVGIHTALICARGDVLAVAWDMPFVSAELLSLICERRGTAAAVIPVSPSGDEPFCALYTPRCLPLIEAALDAGDLRLSHVLTQLPSVERISMSDIRVIGDPATLLFNVNTPEDLTRAETMATRH
jgi:molybdopterin-guanine dinucleotide biosynthesis protein A